MSTEKYSHYLQSIINAIQTKTLKKDNIIRIRNTINLTIDPLNFTYINFDSNDIKTDIADAVYRLSLFDNLSPNSYLNKYKMTKELIDTFVASIGGNDQSKTVLEELEKLGLNDLVGKVSPIYDYYRKTISTSSYSTIDKQRDIPNDLVSLIALQILNDKEYKEKNLSEEDSNKYIDKIIENYRTMFTDQLSIFFYNLKNRLIYDLPHLNNLYLVDPSKLYYPFGTSKEVSIFLNLLNNRYPFPLDLNSVQFIYENDTINIQLNFNDFNVGNMSDVLFGIVLLLLASHESGDSVDNRIKVGQVYINTPYLTIQPDHYDLLEANDPLMLPQYSLKLKVDSTYKDFSTLSSKHIILDSTPGKVKN